MSRPPYNSSDIEKLVRDIASEEGVDPDLAHSVGYQESGFRANATSHDDKGNPVAHGVMQLTPGTAKRFGVKNVYDPAENIRGGVRYLKFLNDRYQGDVDKVAGAYHAGEGAVDPINGPIQAKGYGPKTRNYVSNVGGRYRRAKLLSEADSILGGNASTPDTVSASTAPVTSQANPTTSNSDPIQSLMDEADQILGNTSSAIKSTSKVHPQGKGLDALETSAKPVAKQSQYKIQDPGILPNGAKGLDQVVGRKPYQAPGKGLDQLATQRAPVGKPLDSVSFRRDKQAVYQSVKGLDDQASHLQKVKDFNPNIVTPTGGLSGVDAGNHDILKVDVPDNWNRLSPAQRREVLRSKVINQIGYQGGAKSSYRLTTPDEYLAQIQPQSSKTLDGKTRRQVSIAIPKETLAQLKNEGERSYTYDPQTANLVGAKTPYDRRQQENTATRQQIAKDTRSLRPQEVDNTFQYSAAEGAPDQDIDYTKLRDDTEQGLNFAGDILQGANQLNQQADRLSIPLDLQEVPGQFVKGTTFDTLGSRQEAETPAGMFANAAGEQVPMAAATAGLNEIGAGAKIANELSKLGKYAPTVARIASTPAGQRVISGGVTGAIAGSGTELTRQIASGEAERDPLEAARRSAQTGVSSGINFAAGDVIAPGVANTAVRNAVGRGALGVGAGILTGAGERVLAGEDPGSALTESATDPSQLVNLFPAVHGYAQARNTLSPLVEPPPVSPDKIRPRTQPGVLVNPEQASSSISSRTTPGPQIAPAPIQARPVKAKVTEAMRNASQYQNNLVDPGQSATITNAGATRSLPSGLIDPVARAEAQNFITRETPNASVPPGQLPPRVTRSLPEQSVPPVPSSNGDQTASLVRGQSPVSAETSDNSSGQITRSLKPGDVRETAPLQETGKIPLAPAPVNAADAARLREQRENPSYSQALNQSKEAAELETLAARARSAQAAERLRAEVAQKGTGIEPDTCGAGNDNNSIKSVPLVQQKGTATASAEPAAKSGNLKPIAQGNTSEVVTPRDSKADSARGWAGVIKTAEGWKASHTLKPTEKCPYFYIWVEAIIREDE